MSTMSLLFPGVLWVSLQNGWYESQGNSLGQVDQEFCRQQFLSADTHVSLVTFPPLSVAIFFSPERLTCPWVVKAYSEPFSYTSDYELPEPSIQVGFQLAIPLIPVKRCLHCLKRHRNGTARGCSALAGLPYIHTYLPEHNMLVNVVR